MSDENKTIKNKTGSSSAEEFFYDMLHRKTGAEKINMGFSMFQFASKFVTSSINKKLKSDAFDRDFKKALFLRIYGNDFDKQELEDIIKVITS